MLSVLFWGASFMLGLRFHVKQDQLIILSIAFAAVGFYLPNLWLARQTSKRQEDIRLSLPDALDLMVICVEAGQGMNAALVTVGREMQIHAPRPTSVQEADVDSSARLPRCDRAYEASGPAARTSSTPRIASRRFPSHSSAFFPTSRTHQASASLRLRATPASTRVSRTMRSR